MEKFDYWIVSFIIALMSTAIFLYYRLKAMDWNGRKKAFKYSLGVFLLFQILWIMFFPKYDAWQMSRFESKYKSAFEQKKEAIIIQVPTNNIQRNREKVIEYAKEKGYFLESMSGEYGNNLLFKIDSNYDKDMLASPAIIFKGN